MTSIFCRARRSARTHAQLLCWMTLIGVGLATMAPVATSEPHPDDEESDGGHHAGAPRADSHAPIGVMGDHTHQAGDVMLSYRYMRMNMQGNRDGRHRLTPAQVRAQGFPVVPTEMDMNMHMFGLMYAPHDRITLVGMIPYITASMDHVRLVSTPRFTTESSGIGDITVGGLISLLKTDDHETHVGLNFAIPSGSIRHTDNIVPIGETQLPYPMQIGSGSWSFLPSATYKGKRDDWGWGVQLNGNVRLNKNDLGYRLGDRFNTTAWLSRSLLRSLSASFRLNFDLWGNIDGSDRNLTLTAAPTADPKRRGGNRLEGGVGLNYAFGTGSLEGARLAFEFLFPLTQTLDGPQLETDWNLVAGLQYAF